jgi:radical SAM superfamily enzyme YgiQ (UPF0313 family)
MSGRRYRVQQPQSIVDEIQHLVAYYAVRCISFLDDTFTALPHRLTVPVCREMVRRGLVMPFGCESRVDVISPELVAELKSAGCIAIHFGVESGSQQILDRMYKRITLDQVRDAVRWTVQVGMEAFCSVILGLPGEAEATVCQTRDFLLELGMLGAKGFVVGLLVPFPGSDIYEHRDKHEIMIHETDWGKFNTRLPIISTSQLSRKRLRELYLEITFELVGDKLVVGGSP